MVGALVVVTGGAWIAGYVVAGDQVPKDATVAGVAIGEMSATDATAALQRELGKAATAPIQVRVPGATKPAEVDPADAGLKIDYAASVRAAGAGRSWSPAHVWRVLTGGGETEPVVTVDQDSLGAAARRLEHDHNRAPKDASLTVDGTTVKTTKATVGVTVDPAATATALREGYLGDEPVALPAVEAQPAVTDDEVAALRSSTIDPALSGPVRVSVGAAGSFDVSPTMIGKALQVTSTDGEVTAALDPKTLRAQVDDEVADLDLDAPKDATVRIVGGKPEVVAAVDGTDITATALATAVRPAMTKTGTARRATVEPAGADADFSTADARKLGVKEVTGQFTTYFPYAEYRNVNIGRAAEKIDNTLLKPGETFSLNRIVGERTRANGFTEGNIIEGGKFRLELGGGVSQSATTTYNAMFFAGLQDVEHQPHTLFIDRYPSGREATVAWPSLDLRFKNDTKYGVVVQAFVKKATSSSQGSITVKMWSTKTYDKITSTDLVRSNFTTGRDLTDDDPKCQPMTPVQGFDVNYSRLFYRDGEVVKKQDFFWRYSPTDRVTCS